MQKDAFWPDDRIAAEARGHFSRVSANLQQYVPMVWILTFLIVLYYLIDPDFQNFTTCRSKSFIHNH